MKGKTLILDFQGSEYLILRLNGLTYKAIDKSHKFSDLSREISYIEGNWMITTSFNVSGKHAQIEVEWISNLLMTLKEAIPFSKIVFKSHYYGEKELIEKLLK